MINPNLKSGDRYYGLDAQEQFWLDLVNNPQKVNECCNGVGSEVGFWGKLTYHLIPNTILFLNVTPCSDIHDYDYCYPVNFKNLYEALKHKTMVDKRLFDNLVTYIIANSKYKWLASQRMKRACSYWGVLCQAGQDSFLEGKTFDE